MPISAYMMVITFPQGVRGATLPYPATKKYNLGNHHLHMLLLSPNNTYFYHQE
jgi:hypothetical protein